jgi:hypothetical protein
MCEETTTSSRVPQLALRHERIIHQLAQFWSRKVVQYKMTLNLGTGGGREGGVPRLRLRAKAWPALLTQPLRRRVMDPCLLRCARATSSTYCYVRLRASPVARLVTSLCEKRGLVPCGGLLRWAFSPRKFMKQRRLLGRRACLRTGFQRVRPPVQRPAFSTLSVAGCQV